ncbi:CLIP domain-containing serine protease B8-like [Uranotaenia lowii]|uniref:CLIP domain-containing serine protease B8-like n=1 Tax=Uranotaenia lowii TaxID=190385 RepID=UPI002479BB20|nr:CLIP domain-containing serine protease B8-like [Uranotaenia lowii]
MKLIAVFTVLSCFVFLIASEKCGQRKVSSLLNFSGQKDEVAPEKWPWQAALLQKQEHQNEWIYACGSAIISNQFVVTAAQCTFAARDGGRELDSSEIRLVLGVGQLGEKLDQMPSVEVTEIIRHHRFDRNSLEHDIAVLRLTDELEFTDQVQPICILDEYPGKERTIGRSGYTTGWNVDNTDSKRRILKESLTPIVSEKDCSDNFKKFYHKGKSLCTGSLRRSKGIFGDNGSGLFLENLNQWYLRGVITGEKNDSQRGHNLILTDVAFYAKWLVFFTNPLRFNLLGLDKCGKASSDVHPWHCMVEIGVGYEGDFLKFRNDCVKSTCKKGTFLRGSLIDSKHVLVYSESGNFSYVWFPGVDGAEPLQEPVDRVITFYGEDSDHYRNLYLLELEEPIDRTPVCLPTAFYFTQSSQTDSFSIVTSEDRKSLTQQSIRDEPFERTDAHIPTYFEVSPGEPLDRKEDSKIYLAAFCAYNTLTENGCSEKSLYFDLHPDWIYYQIFVGQD